MAAAAATEGATIETATVTAIVVAIEDTDCPPIHPENAIGEDAFGAQGRGRGSAKGRECVSQNAFKVLLLFTTHPPTHPRRASP